MIKRRALETGSHYGNSANEQGFTGSRIEGDNRVSTMTISIPYTNSVSGEVEHFKSTVKSSVGQTALAADYAVAQEKAQAYIAQELPDAAARATLAGGMIETSIEDIA